MNSFELENNRIIKKLLQLLGSNEAALANEIGATKEDILSWKRGEEIPLVYKKKMHRLTLIAEHGKSFMMLLEKMRTDFDEDSIDENDELEILTECEANLAQSINLELSTHHGLDEFQIWKTHNHFTIGCMNSNFESNVFSAYVSHLQNNEIKIFTEFLDTFIDISNMYCGWMCERKNINSLSEVQCELAHLIIEIIVCLTCRQLLVEGYDSDYESYDEIERYSEITEHAIDRLIETEKFLYGEIDTNYYEFLIPFDDLQEKFISYIDVFEEVERTESYYSGKFDKHLSVDTRELLKVNREILLGLSEICELLPEMLDNNSTNIIVPLINATQELARLKSEIHRAELSGTLKVNEKILKSCTSILKSKGLLI